MPHPLSALAKPSGGRDEPGAFASDFGAQVRAYHFIDTPLALIGAAHASIWSGSTFAKYSGVL
jgi:hypothetical protein